MASSRLVGTYLEAISRTYLELELDGKEETGRRTHARLLPAPVIRREDVLKLKKVMPSKHEKSGGAPYH